MYVAEQFAITTTDALAEVAARGVGDLITHGERGIDVTYLPFVLLPDDGGPRRLTTHVARTNQQWQDEGAATWVVHGPDAYISPGWYAAKAEHGKVVPTWNYQAVHAHGRAADAWPAGQALTASALAQRMRPRDTFTPA